MQRRFTMAAALAVAMLAGCGQRARPLAVTHGWVRLAANPGAPAAAYFTIEGGRQPETLTGVSSDMAMKAEMHETMAMHDRMSGMQPLARVPVAAGADVAFAPGGRHVMLFDVNQGVRPGGDLVMTFDFAGDARVVQRLKVVGPGDPAPY